MTGRVLLVMSGKGGVGKTTVSVNLACAIAQRGLKVGILDVDIHGPNVPKMLGLKAKFEIREKKIIPILKNGMKVASMDFFLNQDDAVIWRGPMKHKMIKQFVEDVTWGELDYLVVDFPPGTGDEALSIAQLMKNKKSIIVSTPQQVALMDMRRAIEFSKLMEIPVIGLIENMSGEIFGKGNVKKLAEEKRTPFLGSIELDKKIIRAGDGGEPYLYKTDSFIEIVDKILEQQW